MLGNVRFECMGVQAIVNGHGGDETTPPISSISQNVLFILLVHSCLAILTKMWEGSVLGNVRFECMGDQAIVNGHGGDETTPPILSISLNVLFILLVHSCLAILTKMWEGSVLGNIRFECMGDQAIVNGHDGDETTPPISSISQNVLFILLVHSCLAILTKMWEGSVLGNVRFECMGDQAIVNGHDGDETTPPISSISQNVLFILLVHSCLTILTKMWEGSVLGNVRFECMGDQAIVNGHDGDETTPPISSISQNVLFILLVHSCLTILTKMWEGSVLGNVRFECMGV